MRAGTTTSKSFRHSGRTLGRFEMNLRRQSVYTLHKQCAAKLLEPAHELQTSICDECRTIVICTPATDQAILKRLSHDRVQPLPSQSSTLYKRLEW
eukprot:4667720-Amphidinium_carterae.1